MPVISKVGRNSTGVKVTLTLMYLFLVCGSVTMIGPFLMMLSSSIGSEADISDYRIVPRFLSDDDALFARFLNDKYNGNLWAIKDLYRYELSRIDVRTGTVTEMVRNLRLRDQVAAPEQQKFIAEYGEFLEKGIPSELYYPGYVLRGGLIGPSNKLYQEWLKAKFGSIEAMNRAYSEQYAYWAELIAPGELIYARDWAPLYNQRYRDFLEFKKNLPAWQRVPYDGTRKWVDHLKILTDANIDKLNAMLGTHYTDFYQVPMPLTAPTDPKVLKLWNEFVRRKWPLRLIEVNENRVREYHTFLQARRKTIDQVNEAYGTNYTNFDQVPWPHDELFDGMRQNDFLDFLKNESASQPQLSLKNVTLRTTGVEFRKWLLARHGGTLDGINSALGTKFASLDSIAIPQATWEWTTIQSNPRHWRWEYVKANYFEVMSFIFTKGRALSNTLIFIVLSIVVTLTVNRS